MGIPYSREINAAFEQVTPLVAAGFQVLRTTKNISILLAIIQVLTVGFLAAILGTLILLLIICNPDMEVSKHLSLSFSGTRASREKDTHTNHPRSTSVRR
jgi:hypothetical protein